MLQTHGCLASERIWFFRRSATVCRLIAKLPRPSNLAAFDSKTSDQFVRQASHRREPQTNSLATSNAVHGPLRFLLAAIVRCALRRLYSQSDALTPSDALRSGSRCGLGFRDKKIGNKKEVIREILKEVRVLDVK
jgi:hypothetical protein